MSALDELLATTSSGKQMVTKYGPDPTKWPKTTNWYKGLSDAGLLPTATPDPPPPPPPATTGYDALVSALTPPRFEFNTAQHVVVTDQASFLKAYAALAPGGWIECRGITFTGTVKCQRALSGLAKITYDSECKFTGNNTIGSAPTDTLEVTGAAFTQHLAAPGVTMTNPGGRGIHAVGGLHHCAFDGFHIKDCGADGWDWFGGPYGDTHDNFIRVEVENCALQSLKWDPHQEKGTGLHGANVQDSNHSSVHDNTIALHVHDFPKYGGSAIEFGVVSGGSQPYGNHLYVKAARLKMNATTQTAGNGVNLWGGPMHDNTFHVVEVEDMAGHAINRDGSSASYTNMTVREGTAVNCCQNQRYAGQNPWMKRAGLTYTPGPFTPAP